jgi:hypothetical protein
MKVLTTNHNLHLWSLIHFEGMLGIFMAYLNDGDELIVFEPLTSKPQHRRNFDEKPLNLSSDISAILRWLAAKLSTFH